MTARFYTKSFEFCTLSTFTLCLMVFKTEQRLFLYIELPDWSSKCNHILCDARNRLYTRQPQIMTQINQPTRCNSFTSLLLDVYVWLNIFRAPLLPSSGAYNRTRSLRFYRWSVEVGALLVVVWQVMPMA
jgi:hypothetical protein